MSKWYVDEEKWKQWIEQRFARKGGRKQRDNSELNWLSRRLIDCTAQTLYTSTFISARAKNHEISTYFSTQPIVGLSRNDITLACAGGSLDLNFETWWRHVNWMEIIEGSCEAIVKGYTTKQLPYRHRTFLSQDVAKWFIIPDSNSSLNAFELIFSLIFICIMFTFMEFWVVFFSITACLWKHVEILFLEYCN